MESKIINLFEKSDNSEKKYSELLQQFITAFSADFSEADYFDEIIEFAMMAWNFGNMRVIAPKQDFEGIMAVAEQDDVDVVLLNKMIAYKVANFSAYSNFILDYEVEKTNEDTVLILTTQEEETYFAAMSENIEQDYSQEEFKENHINRIGIILKPQQPFLDWHSNLYSEEIEEIKESSTYLISEDVYDVEAWIKKKFDILFQYELEAWHTNKKEWPQRRNYKMFREWFKVDISKMIFDMEKEPVSKA